MSHTRAHLLSTLVLAAASAAHADPSSSIEAAHQAYHWGQFDRSLAMYEQLAAQGNAEAAERAGYMLMQGPGVYGPKVSRDEVRAAALLEQAASAGRPHALFVLGMAGSAD